MSLRSSKSLELIKAFAIILIVNSHLDWLWGSKFIAAGGSLGNSLFFIVSGIGLAIGSRRHPRMGFLSWYSRRIRRIYPSAWTVSLIGIMLSVDTFQIQSLRRLIIIFLYPTAFWFITAILLLYIPGYFVLRYLTQKMVAATMVAISMIYLVWYSRLNLSTFAIEGGSYFRWIFYLLVFLCGILLVKAESCILAETSFDLVNHPEESCFRTQNSLVKITLFTISLLIYIASKFAFAGLIPSLLQFQLLVHVATFFLILSFLWMSGLFSALLSLVFNPAWSVVLFISSLSLEIYLLDSLLFFSSTHDLISKLFAATSAPFKFLLFICYILFIAAGAKLISLTTYRLAPSSRA